MTPVALGALWIGATVATKVRIAPEPLLRFGDILARGGRISATKWDRRRAYNKFLLTHQRWWRKGTIPIVSSIMMIRDDLTTNPLLHDTNVGETWVIIGLARYLIWTAFYRASLFTQIGGYGIVNGQRDCSLSNGLSQFIFFLMVNCRSPPSLPVGPIPSHQHNWHRTTTLYPLPLIDTVDRGR